MSPISRYTVPCFLHFSYRVRTLTTSQTPTVRFTPLQLTGEAEGHASRWLSTRFGATCLQHAGGFIVLGGVARDHLLGQEDEALLCSLSADGLTTTRLLLGQSEESTPRPLFAGHSAVAMADGSFAISGGGATCFSMGTFWNKGVYTLRIPAQDGGPQSTSPPGSRWMHEKTVDIIPGDQAPLRAAKPQEGGSSASIIPIVRLRVETEDDFLRVVREGRPVVIEGLDLGSCVSAWTPEYLVEKVGADRKVTTPPHCS